jgi:hypothetical protein
MRTFGTMREEVTGGWRQLRNEELSQDRQIKDNGMGMAFIVHERE